MTLMKKTIKQALFLCFSILYGMAYGQGTGFLYKIILMDGKT